MKKYLLGFFIVAVAFVASAFSSAPTASRMPFATKYFWYDLQGNALNGGSKTEEPSASCTTAGTGCARGFLSVPAHPTTDTPDATRAQNP